jgi:hypothetical protein
VRREFTILGGFLLAALAATVFLLVTIAFLSSNRSIFDVDFARAFTVDWLIGASTYTTLAWLVIAFVVMLPAYLVIDHAEARRIRRVGFYVLAGAGIAMIPWGCVVGFLVLVAMHDPGSPGPLRPTAIQAFGAAALSFAIVAAQGLVAGLVYWAVAGRTAAIRIRQRPFHRGSRQHRGGDFLVKPP